MFGFVCFLCRTTLQHKTLLSSKIFNHRPSSSFLFPHHLLCFTRFIITGNGRSASKPSLSIWRRKKELAKEGLITVKELKRLQSNPVKLERFIQSHVSRLLKSDLVAVLAEFQRQDLVFLSMRFKIFAHPDPDPPDDGTRAGFVVVSSRSAATYSELYDVVRKEIWYRPDMFFYRDMLMMVARNKKIDEYKRLWEDLKREEVLFDQHTFGDLVRAFLDAGLPTEAMEIYDEMRQSPDPPLSLPYRVMLKGLIPYPELREQVKGDFLDLFPDMMVFDLPEDFFEDEQRRIEESEEE